MTPSTLEAIRSLAFNAGSLEHSIIVDRQAYLEVAEPVAVFAFSKH